MYKNIYFLILIYLNFIYAYKRNNDKWNNNWKASEYGINDGKYEIPDLNNGACENTEYSKKRIKLDDKIAAFPSNLYKNYCGKKIIVFNTNKNINITLTVADECPTCDNNQMDIPAYTWNKLMGKTYYKIGNKKIEEKSPGYIKKIKWKIIN